jgi:secondary thiamine-phosphate synthase enzyme
MKSTLIFFLGFFLPLVASFVVPPSLAQQQKPPSAASSCPAETSSSPSSLSSQSTDTMSSAIPKWFQHEISITAPSRGCHLITSQVNKAISSDISQIKVGMCNLFIQHTSASLTVNENADPDVRRDLEAALNKIVPASWNHDGTFKHTMEGDDDMPVRHIERDSENVALRHSV